MPKFSFDSSFSLKAALTALGMPIAFSDQAIFRNDGQQRFNYRGRVHKAYVAVDEQGQKQRRRPE